MTEFRDAFDESLLSAYLDGELKDEERAHVERVLLERSDLRAMLQSLQSMRTQLRSLQVVRSPNDLRQKVLPRIEAMRTPSAPPPRPTLLSNRFRWAAVAAGVAAVMALMPWVTSDRSNTHLAEHVSELDRGLPADSEMRQDSQDNNALVPAPRSASTSGAVNEMPKSGESDVEILADKSAAGNLPVAVDGGEVTENGRRGETLDEVQVQTLNVDALSPEMQSYVLSNDVSTVLNVKTSAPITRDELLDALANREIAVDELTSDGESVGDSSESRVAEGSALEEVETQVPNGKEVSSPQVAVASEPVTTQDQVADSKKDEVTV
ncbi:MAG: hypothetical protein O2931_13785, partial [Planctomycetota bacterium]|nr:hypothetical protein [Planctomycetota bacterium]